MAGPDQEQLTHLFFVPFFSHLWAGKADLNARLRDLILAREKEHPGQRKTNVGGWQSTEDLHRWTGEAGQELVGMVTDLVNTATSQLFAHFQTSDEFSWGLAMWANVNRRGDYNLVHVHPGSTWSCVYYVDAGDVDKSENEHGAITFFSPLLASTNSFFTKALPNQFTVQPEAGRMVLFPSYLQHQVHPYFGEKPRISIAINIIKKPFP